MEQRALPFDPQQVPVCRAVADETVGGPGDVVRDDVVDRDAPACDGDARLSVGTNADDNPRARASRSSSRVTLIFPIAQSEPTE